MQHLLWEGWTIASRSIEWPKVRCVSFDQKTKGDRGTVRKLSTGQPWFSSSNFSNVRCLSCCHIVRPAACIGSWLYQTYSLRLTTSYSIVCCPNWWRRTRIFRPGKRQNLVPAMQLNRRYSWRYRKVKFMCAISFYYYYYYYYYYYSQNSRAPNDDFPLNALKTHLRLSRVLLTEKCILNSAYINLVRRAKSEANDL